MSLLRKLAGDRAVPRATTVQAVWRDAVLAKSASTVVVDGKHYFPPLDVRWALLHPVDKETVCLWKGRARYYDIEVAGRRKKAGAWVYPEPQPQAAGIEHHVAFARGVKVRAVDGQNVTT